jgi:hypothetical protein
MTAPDPVDELWRAAHLLLANVRTAIAAYEDRPGNIVAGLRVGIETSGIDAALEATEEHSPARVASR